VAGFRAWWWWWWWWWGPEDGDEEEEEEMAAAMAAAAAALEMEVGVLSRWGSVAEWPAVGEALRLEFLLLMAEKSMRSSLLDSSPGSSLGTRKATEEEEEEERPPTITPEEERMWRRSCLRLCEVIWLVEVKVKPQPARMQWKWLVALL